MSSARGVRSALLLSLLAGCGGAGRAPAPKAHTPLPEGSQLAPFDATKPGRPGPQSVVAGPGGSVFIGLSNLDAATYSPSGPGFLVRLQPEVGASSEVLINLGGSDGHACTNSGTVKNEDAMLLAVCSGSYTPGDLSGRALVEVDPAHNVVTRRAAAPVGLQPYAAAVGSTKIWLGSSAGAQVYSVNRTTFTFADGADAAHPAIQLPCSLTNAYVADLLLYGSDLFALCGGTDGYLVRLDSQTGAQKGPPVLTGAQPTALALTGDGRLAVLNSTDNTLSLVTLGTPMVSTVFHTFTGAATLQDLKARGQFLYLTDTGSNTVLKVDLTATDPGRQVAGEVNLGINSGPWSILPLDDDQAVATDNLSGDLAGVNFAAK